MRFAMFHYNPDFSLVFNVFANAMVVVGAITVVWVISNISWWIFCQTFKFVDRVINDYDYN
jgi:hypothetical protein